MITISEIYSVFITPFEKDTKIILRKDIFNISIHMNFIV